MSKCVWVSIRLCTLCVFETGSQGLGFVLYLRLRWKVVEHWGIYLKSTLLKVYIDHLNLYFSTYFFQFLGHFQWCSGTPGSDLKDHFWWGSENYIGCWVSNWVSHVQGKHSICCASALALSTIFINVHHFSPLSLSSRATYQESEICLSKPKMRSHSFLWFFFFLSLKVVEKLLNIFQDRIYFRQHVSNIWNFVIWGIY